MKVNPFDQPNVQEAKVRTKELLDKLRKGALPPEQPAFRAGGLRAFADESLLKSLKATRSSHLPLKDVLSAHLARLSPGDFCSILAYIHSSPENHSLLTEIKNQLSETTSVPVTLGYGPRYLHSTGQLYKGGSPGGLFILLTETDAGSLAIPGQKFNFGTLQKAQARGDFQATAAKRRILRLDLERTQDSLRALLNALKAARPACRN